MKMRAHKGLLVSAGRGVVIATIAALVVTMAEPPVAFAGSAAPASKGVTATAASSDATDFSAARRRRRYSRGGDAAGLAFFGMALGTIGAIAAQQNYGYGYGYGPGYYGGGPYYGGPYPYYGRRYYYQPY
jgi:hypothetical protein